jgi:hypothetical protein
MTDTLRALVATWRAELAVETNGAEHYRLRRGIKELEAALAAPTDTPETDTVEFHDALRRYSQAWMAIERRATVNEPMYSRDIEHLNELHQAGRALTDIHAVAVTAAQLKTGWTLLKVRKHAGVGVCRLINEQITALQDGAR